jgi:hypothetical protein
MAKQTWPETTVVAALFALAGVPALLGPALLADVARAAIRGVDASVVVLAAIVVALIGHVLGRRFAAYKFLEVLHHESAHLVVSLLMLAPPSRLHTTPSAGYTDYQVRGPFAHARGFLIASAPYWFSPLVLAAAVLVWVVEPYEALGKLGIALLGMWGLLLMVSKLGVDNSDIKRFGNAWPLLACSWVWAAEAVLVVRMFEHWSLEVLVQTYQRAWLWLWTAV